MKGMTISYGLVGVRYRVVAITESGHPWVSEPLAFREAEDLATLMSDAQKACLRARGEQFNVTVERTTREAKEAASCE